MLMKRTDDRLSVESAIGDRPAPMGADGGQGPQRPVAEPEHGDLFTVHCERAPFADWNLIRRTEHVPARDRMPAHRVTLKSPGSLPASVCGIGRFSAITGTWGRTSSGSAVRNWPGVNGSARSLHGST